MVKFSGPGRSTSGGPGGGRVRPLPGGPRKGGPGSFGPLQPGRGPRKGNPGRLIGGVRPVPPGGRAIGGGGVTKGKSPSGRGYTMTPTRKRPAR